MIRPKPKFLQSQKQIGLNSLKKLTANNEKKITSKVSDLDFKKNSHSVPSFFSKFQKNNKPLQQNFEEIKEEGDKMEAALQENKQAVLPGIKITGLNIQELKGKTSNGFFLTNLNSVASQPKKIESNKINFFDGLYHDVEKREKFSLNIDSRPKRSIFFVELVEKKKAEKLEKNSNTNKNNDSVNKQNNNKKAEKSLTPFIRKENKLIMDGIKKRTGSVDGITNFISGRTLNNFNNFNTKINNSKKNPKKTSLLKKEFKTFHNSSPAKTPLIYKNDEANSSSCSSRAKSDDRINKHKTNQKAKTYTSGFIKITKHTNSNFISEIYKSTNDKIKANYKKALVHSANINHELNDLYSIEQNTTGMRFDLIRNHDRKQSQLNYDYLKEQKETKPRNNVKGIYNIDSGEMVYIDENKANIINHVDTILKMRNENFYKFRNVCVDKYNNYARQNDIFEYVFGNARYVPKGNFHKIDDNTFKFRKLYANFKKTNSNIKNFFEKRKKD